MRISVQALYNIWVIPDFCPIIIKTDFQGFMFTRWSKVPSSLRSRQVKRFYETDPFPLYGSAPVLVFEVENDED